MALDALAGQLRVVPRRQLPVAAARRKNSYRSAQMHGRESVLAAALLVAVTAAAAAAGAPRTDTAVRPGVGIGAVRLGMTQAQVGAALGRGARVARRERVGFGSQYVELEWSHGAWRVAFEGRPGRFRAVKVATTLSTQRARGVGPGSRLPAVRIAFPSARCLDKWLTHRAPNTFVPSSFQGRWLVVGDARARHTVFVVGYRFSSTNTVATPAPGRVDEVVVQAPVRPGKVISTACPSGWERDAASARPLRYGPP